MISYVILRLGFLSTHSFTHLQTGSWHLRHLQHKPIITNQWSCHTSLFEALITRNTRTRMFLGSPFPLQLVEQSIGGFQKWWYPKIIHFDRIFQYKPSMFRTPPLILTQHDKPSTLRKQTNQSGQSSIEPVSGRPHLGMASMLKSSTENS